MLGAREAEESIRQAQQGRGKPIISLKTADHQMVAVGKTIHWSKTWKSFPDFLSDYIKKKLDPAWGNAEIAKPLPERHPLLQWYDSLCRYQQKTITTAGEVVSADVTGVVACYVGTAYALYLLDHNVELQARLINRLKDPGNFQGAYYELIVASALIRAGFTLTLEDETDASSKHCEFAAVSPRSGKRYWVEAKMRSVTGLLGRTSADGGPEGRPLSRLIPHLNNALSKPANDERLIFIDVNTPFVMDADAEGKPDWLGPAITRLERYEQESLTSVKAYVFVTNMAFHRHLDTAPGMAAFVFGLGMPDFYRPGAIRVTDAYRQKQKHIDAYVIAESIENYCVFPSTFDGKLPSESLGRPTSRVKIGETYHFPDAAPGGITGTVTSATVEEDSKRVLAGVASSDGQSHLIWIPMSDADFGEYSQFRDAYFGQVVPVQKNPKTPFELFEWLMETHKTTPRGNILGWLSAAPNAEELAKLSDDDLRMTYCEGLVASMAAMASKAPASASLTPPEEPEAPAS